MSELTKLMSRAGKVTAIAAATTGLVLGLATAPASAATTSGARLTISSISGNTSQYRVSITGVYPMTQADAQGYLDNMGTVGGMIYSLRGDDPGPNDRYLGSHRFVRGLAANNKLGNALHATPEGLRYHDTITVERSRLNEDDGPFDFTDEIYAEATFVDGDNGRRPATSNVVTANF